MVDAVLVQEVRPLRGRELVVAALEQRLDRAAQGAGCALLVDGPPGAGRTRLLDHVAASARDAGATVLRVTGCRHGRDVRGAGLHRLLRPLLPLADDLPPDSARVLHRAVGAGRLPRGGRLPLAVAVAELLRRAALEGPVVCCVDDVDLLDEASQQVLTLVAESVDGQRVALVCTAGSPLDSGIGATSEHLPLPPLDDEAARLLLADVAPRVLPGHLAARLVHVAGGSPGALVELVAALTPEQLDGRAAPPSSLPPTSAARTDLLARVHTLPDEQRALLLAAALDDELSATEATARGGWPSSALHALLRRRLLHVADGALRVQPGWLAGALTEDAGHQACRRTHARLAAVVDDRRDALRHHLHRALGRDGVGAADAG
ncbi:ATP-binding protein, partial [Thalassiella azotivora]